MLKFTVKPGHTPSQNSIVPWNRLLPCKRSTKLMAPYTAVVLVYKSVIYGVQYWQRYRFVSCFSTPAHIDGNWGSGRTRPNNIGLNASMHLFLTARCKWAETWKEDSAWLCRTRGTRPRDSEPFFKLRLAPLPALLVWSRSGLGSWLTRWNHQRPSMLAATCTVPWQLTPVCGHVPSYCHR